MSVDKIIVGGIVVLVGVLVFRSSTQQQQNPVWDPSQRIPFDTEPGVTVQPGVPTIEDIRYYNPQVGIL